MKPKGSFRQEGFRSVIDVRHQFPSIDAYLVEIALSAHGMRRPSIHNRLVFRAAAAQVHGNPLLRPATRTRGEVGQLSALPRA